MVCKGYDAVGQGNDPGSSLSTISDFGVNVTVAMLDEGNDLSTQRCLKAMLGLGL